MESIQPKYQYIREGGTRRKWDNNDGFYLWPNEKKVKVCKVFVKNTLDLNDRPIGSVLEKQNKVANILVKENLHGKHGKHNKINANLKEDVNNFIEKIPKIESHYTRSNISKHFSDRNKSITDIHRKYVADCNSIFRL